MLRGDCRCCWVRHRRVGLGSMSFVGLVRISMPMHQEETSLSGPLWPPDQHGLDTSGPERSIPINIVVVSPDYSSVAVGL